MPETEKIPISVIILTHRADDRLEKAIASASFAEQVVLIDQGNKTKTTHLEKKYKIDKVVLPEQPPDNFDFSDLRNQSLVHATQEWVFFLDSDEVITFDSQQGIADIIAQPDISAAYVRRRDVFYGKVLQWGEVRHQWLLRMGRKSSVRFLRPVHEVAQYNGQQKRAAVTLLHNSHTSISEFITKVLFYAKIDAYHRVSYHQDFSLWELLANPPAKFMYNYILQFGFLDGWRGLVYAVVMSLHSFFVRVYQYQLESTS